MKNSPTKPMKITATVLILTVAFLLCFKGYNSYIYNKIEECFAAENYTMALHYAESLPKNYKDVRKINSFLQLLIENDEDKSLNYDRIITKLESYKGFVNENVNFCYNKFYIETVSSQKDAEADKKIKKYAAKIKSMTPSTTKAEQTTTEPSEETSYENAVYYLQSSEVYHLYRDCSTLANSKNVLTGEIPQDRRVCKVCESR